MREGATIEHPGLLPSVLTPDPDASGDDRPRPRSARDWLVDLAIFGLAIIVGILALTSETHNTDISGPLLAADLTAAAVMCGALWWRRRWPVGVALLTVPVSMVSTAAGGGILAATFSLTVHRPVSVVVRILALQVLALPVYFTLHPHDIAGNLLLGVLATLGVVAFGMFVRARRQLVFSLRERARRAEAEQQLRVEQARQAERTRIAREMHDVLAHRISLLSLHAGALEFREDASPEEVARAAGVIRASAHQALEDLRAVIGVLREAPGAAAPEPPQPTLTALPALLEESRDAGMRVRADVRVDDLGAVPEGVGRSALRIVQEGLTNARKHAPGAAVDVTVAGGPGDGLEVEVRNRVSVLAVGAPEIPGAGTGLVGLAERAALAGGRLEHELTEGGDFLLRAWLPWPA